MEAPINWTFVAHPINWVQIWLMLVIAGIFGHLVLTYFDVEPSKSSKTLPTGYSTTPQSVTPRST
jgi:hypothetical protein